MVSKMWTQQKRDPNCENKALRNYPLKAYRVCLCLSIHWWHTPPAPTIPAETYLLVEHQSPLQRPAQPVLKPALTAEQRRQAHSRRHVAGRSTLPQVRQEKARPAALAHGVQSPRRLSVANVAHGLAQVCRVSELLQLEGGERGAVVAAAVENCREVAVGQRHFTQLERERG